MSVTVFPEDRLLGGDEAKVGKAEEQALYDMLE